MGHGSQAGSDKKRKHPGWHDRNGKAGKGEQNGKSGGGKRKK